MARQIAIRSCDSLKTISVVNRRNAPEEALGLHSHERQLSKVKPALGMRFEIRLVGLSGSWGCEPATAAICRKAAR